MSHHVAGCERRASKASHGALHSVYREVAQEGISGPERKKCRAWEFSVSASREESVHYLVGGSIAANRDETAITAGIVLASDVHGVARGVRFGTST